ncbi:MAG TPA: YceH family protein [Terrimicrobiaceae bacterium]|nr:YceH family protein [Terrimicrobiaceae bacterium]
MPLFTLTPVETRLLGCLLEKERITPENYPLSLNSLIAACNQSTNRDPITAYDARTVEAGLDGLRQKKLAVMIMSAGSRVAKFRHEMLNHFDLSPREVALLCVLLLRGPQTLGELRSRTERIQFFDSLEQIESFLAELAKEEPPLVRLLPARPGQKESRYVQLLSGEPVMPETAAVAVTASPPAEGVTDNSRLETMEKQLAELTAELRDLREELLSFRKQFE